MASRCFPRAHRFFRRINTEDDLRHLLIAGIVSGCIQEPQVGREVLAVIGSQAFRPRHFFFDTGIDRRFSAERLPEPEGNLVLKTTFRSSCASGRSKLSALLLQMQLQVRANCKSSRPFGGLHGHRFHISRETITHRSESLAALPKVSPRAEIWFSSRCFADPD